MRTVGLLAGLVVVGALIAACGGNDEFIPVVQPPSPLQNLTQRGHVLQNVEAAYNNRRIDWYNGALDANFTFFLSPGDVGGNIPESWNRADEISLNTRLFDKNYVTLPCQSILLDLRIEDGITWIPFNPAGAPAETWYSTTLNYYFKFEIAPNTYIPLPGAKLTLTVRNAGSDSTPHWQLVEMRDLGGASALQLTTGTQPSDLGQIKALYR